MRVMAVDYGDARTGVAVSDMSATMAGEAWVLRVNGQNALAAAIADEAVKREAGTIVVGYPKNMDGSAGPRAEKSEQLVRLLRENCGIEVVLWDERLTTASAHKILSDSGVYGKKRKSNIDAVAATLILEGYLQYSKGAGSREQGAESDEQR